MMSKALNILIVEDHPLIAESYINILNSIEGPYLTTDLAFNCDETIQRVIAHTYDLIFLDIRIPASSNQKFLDGEDLGIFIKKHQPRAKILVITAIMEPMRIHSVFKFVNPEGFIIKSDTNSQDIYSAVRHLLNGGTYYSSSARIHRRTPKGIRQLIDNYDRMILYHLSLGEKTKDLQKFVPLSRRGIEERKVKLRDLFGIDKNSETNLIKEAKKRNII